MTDVADERPAEFDARLMGYLPALYAMAKRLVPPEKREDLVQDTIAKALQNWRNFREDGGFYNWLRFIIRSTAHAPKRLKRPLRYVSDPDGKIANTRGVTGGQEEWLELLDALRILDSKPDQKAACLAIAMNGTSAEAAAADGVTTQAICMRAIRGREMLREAS